MILSFPFFYLTFFGIYDLWNKSLVFNVIYKNSRIYSCFPERFYWLHNWLSCSKNSKAFSISTAVCQLRCKPAFFACNLHSFATFGIVFFLCVLFFMSRIMWRSLTSQIIAGLPRARNARGTEPHTHRSWSTSFRLVVTWLTERTYVRTRLQIVRVG